MSFGSGQKLSRHGKPFRRMTPKQQPIAEFTIGSCSERSAKSLVQPKRYIKEELK